ncbi:MAG: CinA family nicotinamide mononucleotide deamidase-related protein [Bacteroidales bacterium]|nr:CinA family nicotinamide mononucleotide deamidase-related protein [Bacteroidales bacterium]
MTKASICTIGDEILIGQIIDTNSAYIARELNKLGIQVRYILSIGDNKDEIMSNLTKCLQESDIVITTGGLGPTRDDITKDCLAQLSGAGKLIDSQEQWAINKAFFERRGIEVLDINRAQSYVPDTCRVIPNRLGSAPVMEFILPAGKFGHKTALYAMPGVPFEAIGALPDVMASIKKEFDLEEIVHKTVLTYGIPESVLAKRIEKWENALPEWLKLAYLPSAILGVRLRLSCYGASDHTRIKVMDERIEELYSILGNAVYGTGEESLQSILPRLLKCPPEAAYQETLSVAESCTGGYLSHLITSVPGCSAYYKGSVTSYSNEVKINILGVPTEIIAQYGAVSAQCAEAMAKGVLTALDTDYGIATTGIAGPDGGTKEKPVGLCWIAAAHRSRTTGDIEVVSKQLNYSSTREINIERFASNALNLLRQLVEQQLF